MNNIKNLINEATKKIVLDVEEKMNQNFFKNNDADYDTYIDDFVFKESFKINGKKDDDINIYHIMEYLIDDVAYDRIPDKIVEALKYFVSDIVYERISASVQEKILGGWNEFRVWNIRCDK